MPSPCSARSLIGGSAVVSATNGKTTTAKMAAAILEPEHRLCRNARRGQPGVGNRLRPARREPGRHRAVRGRRGGPAGGRAAPWRRASWCWATCSATSSTATASWRRSAPAGGGWWQACPATPPLSTTPTTRWSPASPRPTRRPSPSGSTTRQPPLPPSPTRPTPSGAPPVERDWSTTPSTSATWRAWHCPNCDVSRAPLDVAARSVVSRRAGRGGVPARTGRRGGRRPASASRHLQRLQRAGGGGARRTAWRASRPSVRVAAWSRSRLRSGGSSESRSEAGRRSCS